MKLTVKKTMALMITVLMLFVAAPLNANAETQNVLNYEVSNGQATIVNCDKAAKGKLTIPITLGGFPVTSIGEQAFYDCNGLTSITIPVSVTRIGDEAFHRCDALKGVYVDAGNPAFASENGVLFNKSKTKLIQYPAGKTGLYTIPNSVKSIGVEAFFNCEGLISINIPNSVKSIGEDAFEFCSALNNVTIPNSVTSIGNSAFSDCTGLTSITISDSVKRIGYDIVLGATNLKSINVSKANKVYASENGVLFNHTKKELIRCPEDKTGAYTIPNSVTSIGSFAFCFCEGLKSVNIPNSVKNIGEQAFHSCIKLKSVTIPNSVTSIGYRSFWETAWYNNQPDGLIYAGKVAYYYKGNIPDNTAIVLKPGTKGIADGAFEPEASEEDNIGLIGVIIPNSVTNIGEQAFANCSGLKNVTIPKSVVSIGEQAFGYYIGLESADKNPGFNISCFANSAGLRYAKENGVAFNILTESATTTDLTATTGSVTTIVNESTSTTAASTATSSGISSRVTVPAVILTTVVFLAVAVTAVLIITKKKRK